tara:strand:- start:8533 stop:11298 length:2766 start_codon:yes stop_codon:yes gene_type:complete
MAIFDKYVVNTILVRFKETHTDKIILITIWTVSIIYLGNNLILKHKFSEEISGFIVIIGLIYINYRFINMSRYEYLGSNNFKYSDVTIVFALVFAYLYFYHKIKSIKISYFNKEIKSNENVNGFFTDVPLGYDDKDFFNWGSKSSELINKILATTAEQSFAIGISSEWGAGKTSFFNLLKKEVIPNNEKNNLIFLDFNPWFSGDTRKIIEDFFHTLQEAIERYDSSISNKIAAYSYSLQSITGDKISKIINTGVGLYFQKSEISSKYTSINSSIKQLNKKIIIFIDDLDRLDNLEVIEVLRIVRNTSNFHNFFFIIAYDRLYINNSVSKINDYNYSKYLDKIIQFELLLPIYDVRILNEIFYDKLNEKLANDESSTLLLNTLPVNSYKYTGEKDESQILWNEKLTFDIVNYLQNIRDIHRFLNHFIFDYFNLKEAVNFRDMFLLSLLKFKFINVWKVLSNNNNKKIFLDNKQGVLILKEAERVKEFLITLNLNTSKSDFESKLDDLISADKERQDKTASATTNLQRVLDNMSNERLIECEKVYRILQALFCEKKGEESSYNSLIYDSNHALYYFSGTNLSNNKSLSIFFKNLRDENVSESEFSKSILEKLKNKEDVYEVLGLIHQFNMSYGSLVQFRKLILTYVEILFSKTAWPKDEVKEIITRIGSSSGPGIENSDKIAIIDYIIEEYAKDFDRSCFISYLLQQIIFLYSRKMSVQVENRFSFPLEKSTIQKMVLQLLEGWSKEFSLPKFTNKINLYIIFYSCVDKIDEKSNKVTLLKDSAPFFRDAILKDTINYLSTLIRPKYSPENFESTYVLEPYVFFIWNNYRQNEGLRGFEMFLNKVGFKLKENIHYLRVVYFYAAVVAKNGDNMTDLEQDSSLFFSNYKLWLDSPGITPINPKFEELHTLKMKEVVDRLLSRKD